MQLKWNMRGKVRKILYFYFRKINVFTFKEKFKWG